MQATTTTLFIQLLIKGIQWIDSIGIYWSIYKVHDNALYLLANYLHDPTIKRVPDWKIPQS